MATQLWRSRTRQPSRSRRSGTRVLGAFIIVALCVAGSRADAAAPPPPHFDLQLTTTRGCRETGQDPVYVVGESVTVTFRIGSGPAQHATATLFDILPDGRVGVTVFGQFATNRTRSFQARVARPTGVERLLLKAEAPWAQTTRTSCSFVVVAGPIPTATATSLPSATPTATASPPPNASGTPTPAAALSAEIRTNRGCLETGDNPAFAIGESILVSLRMNSASLTKAQASILAMLPNGSVNLFAFGFLQTNVTFHVRGRIGAPTGVHTLQLRARAFKVQTAVDTCSFLVGGAPPATRTRTPTAPATPTATSTATPTPSPAPTPP